MLIFGNGKFADVIKHYDDHPLTVHRMYCRQFRDLPFEDLSPENSAYRNIIIAVGYRYRRKIYEEIVARGFSPMGLRNKELQIAGDCIVFELNNFQPFVSVGNNNVFWSGSHFGHHAKIGSHNFITSHCVISGSVEIGDECFLGVNCTVLDGIKIGNRCIIAAGAVVDRDIPDNHILSRKGVLIALEKDSELAPIA